ncbi:hypothetical protein DPMN_002526 [Dreissena polymorpha]|uniref:Uncharacterized protein n=1 Tax=Dreissena polymorpha TaxID=45954 RepID=A0A9D4MMH3_DREPO|nr:hypothetical protein DPMN_002526 [Dreissena polymorpha]
MYGRVKCKTKYLFEIKMLVVIVSFFWLDQLICIAREKCKTKPRHARYSMSCIGMALTETIKQLRPIPAFTVLFCLVAINVKILSSIRGLNPRPPEW